MGASESKPSAGFKIISVSESSPARHAGLQPNSDFIVSINGNHLTGEGSSLTDVLKANVGKDCTLLVFNANNLNTREVIIVPVAGEDPLGAVVKYTQFEEESCDDHGHSHSHGSHGHSHSHGSHGHSHSHGACDDDHGHSH